nr:hypothetical protein [uncultured Acetobacter sp.]
MLTGILTATFHTLSRHKLDTLINLIGFAPGIAVFLTIMLVVRYEESYDSYIIHASGLLPIDELLSPAGLTSLAIPRPRAVKSGKSGNRAL